MDMSWRCDYFYASYINVSLPYTSALNLLIIGSFKKQDVFAQFFSALKNSIKKAWDVITAVFPSGFM
jgi:hypothetical protein